MPDKKRHRSVHKPRSQKRKTQGEEGHKESDNEESKRN